MEDLEPPEGSWQAARGGGQERHHHAAGAGPRLGVCATVGGAQHCVTAGRCYICMYMCIWLGLRKCMCGGCKQRFFRGLRDAVRASGLGLRKCREGAEFCDGGSRTCPGPGQSKS